MLSKLKNFNRDGTAGVSGGRMLKVIGLLIAVYLVVVAILGFLWDDEPEVFDVRVQAEKMAEARGQEMVVGYTTTATLIHIAETLLEKPGGYLSNDVFPPGVLMDNIPNWEYGVLVQVRDLARAMRQGFSRSQSQSLEDPDLVVAEPQLNFDSESWILPSTEAEYQRGITALDSYLNRLSSAPIADARFYARADNLRSWLSDVESRLGSLSRRLSENAGKNRPGEAGMDGQNEVKNPWHRVDDIFYEARGSTWALLHMLKAIEIDFRDVLEQKNALVSLQQIIVELEETQNTLWSPVILNGSGFGLFANHSLSLASYIARTNASIIELRDMLAQG